MTPTLLAILLSVTHAATIPYQVFPYRATSENAPSDRGALARREARRTRRADTGVVDDTAIALWRDSASAQGADCAGPTVRPLPTLAA